MKIWKEEGGHETWGVRYPNGSVREYTSEQSARDYVAKMEGQWVLTSDGEEVQWTGLKVMHRYMPPWEEVDQ